VGSANVKLVRSIFAAWERGDFASVEWAHAEIEFAIADGPAPGSWRGLAGMAAGFRDYVSTWAEYRVEAEDYYELDDGRVVAFLRLGGRGKTSGLDLDQMQTRAANVFEVRNGKVTRLTLYFERDRALGDLGLGPAAGLRRS
jgi:ketosteroid isomerase-like protein